MKAVEAPFARDVREGLTAERKSLPPRHFYDAEGSALFERITELDEYYLTRTERGIFEHHADAIMEAAGSDIDLVELGAGSAAKTRVLIRALLDRQASATYYPIDISAAATESATKALAAEFPELTVVPVVGRYDAGLAKMAQKERRCLVLFIGSSIGNFRPDGQRDFLSMVNLAMHAGDALLLGTDMRKDASVLVPAYDDPHGVTEAFNKNVLARVNRELGGQFDLDAFRHVAEWNADESAMQMFLESVVEQDVRIDGLGLTLHFDEGERLHTENSYKFTPEMVRGLADGSGFELERSWYDGRRWFGVHLLRKPW